MVPTVICHFAGKDSDLENMFKMPEMIDILDRLSSDVCSSLIVVSCIALAFICRLQDNGITSNANC